MDLKKTFDESRDPEFIERVEVAAYIVGVPFPRVWVVENAIPVSLEFAKKRSNSDETLVAAVQAVHENNLARAEQE